MPVQDNLVEVVTPEFGVMLRSVMTGSWLSMDVLVESLSQALYPSVAVARQITVSPGCQFAVSNVTLDPELMPFVTPLRVLRQSYPMVGVSPSLSVAVAEQVRVSPV